MENKQDISKLLEKFNNSQTVKALDRYFRERSMMEILGVDRDENAHSNFLAWLFENEATGREACKLLLTNCLNKKPSLPIHDIKATREYFTQFQNEIGRVDLVIEYKEGETRKRIVIENKVLSIERNNQTSLYHKYFSQLGGPSDYVFLTVTGESARCRKYKNISYQNLLDGVLIPLTSTISDIPALLSIRDYINVLGVRYSQEELMAIDPFLKEKALQIWDMYNELFISLRMEQNEHFRRCPLIKHLFYVLRHEIGDQVKDIDDFVNGKDYTKYSINGEGYYGKNGLIYKLACHLLKAGYTNVTTLNKMIPTTPEAFIDKKIYLARIRDTRDKSFDKKWKPLNDNIFVRQTGWDGHELMSSLISHVKTLSEFKDIEILEIPYCLQNKMIH